MNKIVLALAGFVALSMQSLTVYDIGTYLGAFNKGVALGFQDDPTDDGTDCYLAAVGTSAHIQTIFDSDQYTDGTFNTAEMISMAQIA